MIKIIQKRKIWFGISAILVVSSIACLLSWGLNLGIDFTGGTLMEFSFSKNSKVLSHQEIKDRLTDLDLGKISIQSSGEKSVILRLKDVDEKTHQQILSKLRGEDKNSDDSKNSESKDVTVKTVDEKGIEVKDVKIEEEAVDLKLENKEEDNKVDSEDNKNNKEADANLTEDEKQSLDSSQEESISKDGDDTAAAPSQGENTVEIVENRFESIGPVIGGELKEKSVKAIIIVLISIVIYIGWTFRKVSRPVSSWKYGLVALIALFHDIIITIGVFSILGHFYGVEVGMPFVVALLTILGYSVNDTIVVFDRTRENLLHSGWDDFEEVVNRSVNETLMRSLNTSLTTLVVLLAIYLFGGATIQYFVLALIIGIIAGTYSSIFIASPLLVSLAKRKNND